MPSLPKRIEFLKRLDNLLAIYRHCGFTSLELFGYILRKFYVSMDSVLLAVFKTRKIKVKEYTVRHIRKGKHKGNFEWKIIGRNE